MVTFYLCLYSRKILAKNHEYSGTYQGRRWLKKSASACLISKSDRFELVVTGAAIDTTIGNMIACILLSAVVGYIFLGFSSGIQPLIGYNYGVRNQKRLMSVFKFSSICAVVIGSGLTAVMKR